MQKLYGSELYARGQSRRSLAKGIGVGVVAGLIGTVVMDLFGMCILLVNGGPDTISFSLIGDAAAAFFSGLITIPGGTPLGLFLHYLIGAFLGLAFGAGISILRLEKLDWRKGVAFGIVFVEAMSIPMLTTAALVLQMTPQKIGVYFATSFIMHLVFGAALGFSTTYGMFSGRLGRRR